VHDAKLEFVFNRFPEMGGKRVYSRTLNSLGVVILDTNFWEYGADITKANPDLSPYAPIVTWVKQTLGELQHDPRILDVIVVAHHPLFSNAKFIHSVNPAVPILESKDLEFLRKTFLPILLASTKVRAYISGHAHGFEHFLHAGRHFIVTGGGGGPRIEYASPPVFPDRFSQESGKRPFNYLLLQQQADGIRMTVRGLNKGESQLYDLYAIDIAR